MDTQLLRDLYDRCDPGEALTPADDRNVDIDALVHAGQRVRGVRWIDMLARHITLSRKPVRMLFTGLPGSGKSTELLRLAGQLGDPKGANLLPVVARAEDTLDINDKIDIPDILAAMLYATERAVLRAEGRDPDDALRDSAMERFWNWLTETDVELKPEIEVKDIGKVVLEMRTRPTLRQRVRKIVAAHLSEFLSKMQREFASLEERSRGVGRRGLVVILDSLEKLHGVDANYHDVLGSAEVVFANGAPFLALPVHAIYTVPPALLTRRHFSDVMFMPMVKLRERSGDEYGPGFAAARSLVESRISRPLLVEILGATQLEARLRRLIGWTGGYPRELVRLLREIVTESLGATPLSDAAFDRVLQAQADNICRTVPDYAFDWLARVAVEQRLILEREDQRPTVDLMLSNNIVMRYLNGAEWFDVHPAVRALPGVRDAIERLGAPDGRRTSDATS